MPLRTHGEYRHGGRKRILLVGADPSSRDGISTLLNTMGWARIAVSGYDDVPETIERELFDAVLLHLGTSTAALERTIRTIKQIRPSLARRIVVISGAERVDRPTLELIERQDLPHLIQEHLVSTLWTTLEDLFLPGGMRTVVPKSLQTPRLVFDSFRWPLPSGVRSSRAFGRQMSYEHSSKIIDLLLNPQGSERISLVGQVLDASKGGRLNYGLPVVLLSESGTLARTTTNRLGEFDLEFESAENVSLEIRLGERSWVSIPLGLLDWVKKQKPGRATGT